MITNAVLEDERGGYIGRMLPLTTTAATESVYDLLPLSWMEYAAGRRCGRPLPRRMRRPT